MRKVKILAIAPYEGLREMIVEAARRHEEIELTAFTGDLDEGVAVLSRVAQRDYDVILSRGSTADMLKRASIIPVIEITFSPFDIIRAIRLAQTGTDTFAFVGYKEFVETANSLGELLNLSFKSHIAADYASASAIMQELKAQGVDLVLCDTISHTAAVAAGMDTLLIGSGAESVDNALQEAVRYAQNAIRAQMHSLFLQEIMRREDKFLMVFENKNLIFSTVEGELKTALAGPLLSDMSSVLTGDSNAAIVKYGPDSLLFEKRNLFYRETLYELITIKVNSRGQHTSIPYASILYSDNIPANLCQNYFTTFELENLVEQQIKPKLAAGGPYLICGEAGTGTFQLAQTLYKMGAFSEYPLYVFDCSLMQARQFGRLFTSSDSPLYKERCVLLFTGVDALPNSQLGAFLSYFASCAASVRSRLIIAANFEYQSRRHLQFMDKLHSYMDCQVLSVPPLRCRQDAILLLCTQIINKLNLELGRQISGIDPAALQLLQKFNWAGNVEQLKQVLFTVMENVSVFQSTISEEAIRSALSRTDFQFRGIHSVIEQLGVDLTKPLDEIEYDILSLILSEPGMTQAKAAQRLGISRSTLWRIMKKDSIQSPKKEENHEQQ